MRIKQKFGYVYLGIGLLWITSSIILSGAINDHSEYIIIVFLFLIVGVINIFNAYTRLFGINYVLLKEDYITVKKWFTKEKIIQFQDIKSVSLSKVFLSTRLSIISNDLSINIYDDYRVNINYIEKRILEGIEKNDTE